MFFALDDEGGLLYVFDTEAAALAGFTDEELEAEVVHFWDDRGAALKVERTGAKQRLFARRVPTHRLVAATAGAPLLKRLADVTELDADARLKSVDDVRRHLAASAAQL